MSEQAMEEAAVLAIGAALRSATAARSDAVRLARAVLLFHRGGPWTDADRAAWLGLTGEHEATTKVLCDLARDAWRRQRSPNGDSGGDSEPSSRDVIE